MARDEATGIEVRFARDPASIASAVELLDRAESAVDAPLVDEAERARLDDVTRFDLDHADHWHPLVALVGERVVGYAGLALGQQDDRARGDLVVDDLVAVPALVTAVRDLAAEHQRVGVELWARHVNDAFVAAAAGAGWVPRRRLRILGRSLDGDVVAPTAPEGITITHHDGSDEDDRAVAAVLAAAYRGTDDGGWTVEDVRLRRDYPWFQPEDVLLARRAGTLLAVHWTKRRDDRQGEVYNLAVHPDAQGLGLGVTMLDAGLAHLAAAGCDDVVLWVDAANTAALRLYASRGFAERWQDVALACDVC